MWRFGLILLLLLSPRPAAGQTPEEVRQAMRPSSGIEPEAKGGFPWGLVLAAAALVFIGAGVGLWYRRRGGGDSFRAAEPDVEALRALDRIKSHGLAERGEWKRHHTELAAVIREYLERRFQLPATQKTTTEFMTDLKTAAYVPEGAWALLREFLEQSDQVKFGGVIPTQEQARNLESLARRFIIQTRANA